MTIVHNLGFPRIGERRELKKALEAYWNGEIDEPTLQRHGRDLRTRHWQRQADAGVDLLPVGDFSWYDHVLDMSVLLGVVPPRFDAKGIRIGLNDYFRMARGRAPSGGDVPACEMTKWFDTNYHYIVPEFSAGQNFRVASSVLFDQVAEAQALGHRVKPVLLGPLSFLWLGKCKGGEFDKLSLLENLLPVYGEILQGLRAQGVEWVQLDEPVLVLDLPQAWKDAFTAAYLSLQVPGLKKLVATYFGGLGDNVGVACRLPVDGLHIDLVRAPEQWLTVLDQFPPYKVLSVGVVDGRNVWRGDLEAILEILTPLYQRLGERLWLAPSCSLLHVPLDLAQEQHLDEELRQWLAFAVQKLAELAVLKTALREGREAVRAALTQSHAALLARRGSARIHNPAVQSRLTQIHESMTHRANAYATRATAQQRALSLPLFPTTTIGSFPQTAEIRAARRDHKAGRLDEAAYQAAMRAHIADAVCRQEALGLDVLVHGEAERNDMVEYFGEQLDGYAFTQHGWVQSYGSRCVKPPIIYGDVARPRAMTVDWTAYAQSLTDKPMKGMLTGPVTMLQWAFVRDDQSRAETCAQIALALRDEVADLEHAGIGVIQIDEPAFREGLPLRRQDAPEYLRWAVWCFRLAACGVRDETQIHTHMCYSEFNDIIAAIADLDADVITIETSRSAMELLDAFAEFHYPNEIGPGVYDIHSPRVATAEEMTALLDKALDAIPATRLWVNPDCGLKTRQWPEVEEALRRMVAAAADLRLRHDARLTA